jgi:hypothetical protein
MIVEFYKNLLNIIKIISNEYQIDKFVKKQIWNISNMYMDTPTEKH